MEVSKDQQRFFVLLYVLASVIVMFGFGAQFSSKAQSGVILVMAGFCLIIVVDFHKLTILAAHNDPSPSSKMGRLDFVASVFRVSGQFLYFIAILSISDVSDF